MPEKSVLDRGPQWPRTCFALDEFIWSLGLEQFVVFYRDRNAVLHVLNFVRLHSTTELLDQGTASVSKLVRAGFREPQPIVRRATHVPWRLPGSAPGRGRDPSESAVVLLEGAFGKMSCGAVGDLRSASSPTSRE